VKEEKEDQLDLQVLQVNRVHLEFRVKKVKRVKRDQQVDQDLKVNLALVVNLELRENEVQSVLLDLKGQLVQLVPQEKEVLLGNLDQLVKEGIGAIMEIQGSKDYLEKLEKEEVLESLALQDHVEILENEVIEDQLDLPDLKVLQVLMGLKENVVNEALLVLRDNLDLKEKKDYRELKEKEAYQV